MKSGVNIIKYYNIYVYIYIIIKIKIKIKTAAKR